MWVKKKTQNHDKQLFYFELIFIKKINYNYTGFKLHGN